MNKLLVIAKVGACCGLLVTGAAIGLWSAAVEVTIALPIAAVGLKMYLAQHRARRS